VSPVGPGTVVPQPEYALLRTVRFAAVMLDTDEGAVNDCRISNPGLPDVETTPFGAPSELPVFDQEPLTTFAATAWVVTCETFGSTLAEEYTRPAGNRSDNATEAISVSPSLRTTTSKLTGSPGSTRVAPDETVLVTEKCGLVIATDATSESAGVT